MCPLPQDTHVTSSGALAPLLAPVESTVHAFADAVEVVEGNAVLASPAYLRGDGNPEHPRVYAVGVVAVVVAVVGAMFDTVDRVPLV